ncbi:Guanylate kinase [Geodia barretti]|uniref:Guanylate kinase n=1 Tax=Geodia barretti TaxID=519541 RepID=A0AA35XBZ2_GEOBA|nr:Guanylate kinase [Geodia barretti]
MTLGIAGLLADDDVALSGAEVVDVSYPGFWKDLEALTCEELDQYWHFTVTATTRTQRLGEEDGEDYLFMDRDSFHQMVREGDFLECAQVYGNWYGVVPKSQGAATMKDLAPGGIFIFLMPPSPQELERRLRERKTETTPDLELRIRTAMDEMRQLSQFDYVVVNDDLETAVDQIKAIITAEKCHIPPRWVYL